LKKKGKGKMKQKTGRKTKKKRGKIYRKRKKEGKTPKWAGPNSRPGDSPIGSAGATAHTKEQSRLLFYGSPELFINI
jgi:hypothetical protein